MADLRGGAKDRQELAHAGAEGDLGGLPGGARAIAVEGLDGGAVLASA